MDYYYVSYFGDNDILYDNDNELNNNNNNNFMVPLYHQENISPHPMMTNPNPNLLANGLLSALQNLLEEDEIASRARFFALFSSEDCMNMNNYLEELEEEGQSYETQIFDTQQGMIVLVLIHEDQDEELFN